MTGPVTEGLGVPERAWGKKRELSELLAANARKSDAIAAYLLGVPRKPRPFGGLSLWHSTRKVFESFSSRSSLGLGLMNHSGSSTLTELRETHNPGDHLVIVIFPDTYAGEGASSSESVHNHTLKDFVEHKGGEAKNLLNPPPRTVREQVSVQRKYGNLLDLAIDIFQIPPRVS